MPEFVFIIPVLMLILFVLAAIALRAYTQLNIINQALQRTDRCDL